MKLFSIHKPTINHLLSDAVLRRPTGPEAVSAACCSLGARQEVESVLRSLLSTMRLLLDAEDDCVDS